MKFFEPQFPQSISSDFHAKWSQTKKNKHHFVYTVGAAAEGWGLKIDNLTFLQTAKKPKKHQDRQGTLEKGVDLTIGGLHSMDNPWIIHGLSMDYPWIIHG